MAYSVDQSKPAGSPESEAGGDDRVTKILGWWKEARAHWSDWRKEAHEAYDIVDGRQWTDEEAQALQAADRAPIVFNRIQPVINSVTGSEAQNRQVVTFHPREASDSGYSELLTNAARWVRDRTNADIEENEAFRDALVTGIGVTETRIQYDTNPDGDIEIVRLDPLEVLPDPTSKRRNFSDGRRVLRERWVPCAEVHAQWPELVEDLQVSTTGDDVHAVPVDATRQDYDDDGTSHYRASKNEYRLIEAQWMEQEHYFRVAAGENGALVDMDAQQWVQARAQAMAMGAPAPIHVKAKRWTWKRSIICGRIELQYGDAPCKTRCSIQFMTGARDRNKRIFYGLVRVMKDPQAWANKWLSQVMHIINSNAKGGTLYEAGAFADPQQAQRDWAKPNAFIQATPGAIANGKIQQRQPITWPSGLDMLMQFAVTSVRDASGVNLEMLGLADRQQAGVLEAQRKQAALTILATWFDALHAYRREQGYVLLEMIRLYISDGRIIRIDSQNGPQYLPLLRMGETVQHDVIVDTAPQSVSVKQQTFETLQQLLPAMAKMGVQPPPEVLEYLPLPESLAKKWVEKMSGGGVPPEVQQQMDQMQQMLQQGQQAFGELQQEHEQMKQRQEVTDAQHELAIAQKDLEVQKAQFRADAEKLKADAVKFQAEQQAQMAQAPATPPLDMTMVDERIVEVMQQVLSEFRVQMRADIEEVLATRQVSFEYGPDGSVSAMNGRQVVRDEVGRIAGLQ